MKRLRQISLLPFRAQFDSATLRYAKVRVTMVLLSMILLIGGYQVADRYGLLFGFFFALALNALAFFYDELHLSQLFPNQELEGQDAWGLNHNAARLSQKIGAPRPRMHLIHKPEPIAFSVGLTPSRSRIYVSEGLIKKLSSDELEAVLTYEIQRVRLQMTSAATLSSTLAGIFAKLASTFDSFLFLRVLRRKRPGQIQPALILFSPLIAITVRLFCSRHDAFEADRATVATLGSEHALARALWKLDAYCKTLPFEVGLADAHLFIVSPTSRYRWFRFASAQPKVHSRIRDLTGHFPL